MPTDNTPDTHTDPAVDRYEGLPASWSLSAREAYVAIEESNANLTPAQLATLYEAAALLAQADACQLVIDADGLTITGSAGQTAAHPLLSEVRLSRVQAMAALKAIGLATHPVGSASAAGAALVSKRWQARGATPGRRSS